MVFAIAAFLLLLIFALIYGLYRLVFYHAPAKRPDVHQIPDSNLYRHYKDRMLQCVEDMEQMPFEEVMIRSSDGLRLYGRLYSVKSGAPLIISFHGFHGTYAWDGYGFLNSVKRTDSIS